MLSNYKTYILTTASLLFIALGSSQVSAEPYLAFKTNNKCSTCHVNPIGGGARNSFGNYYGTHTLPAKAGDGAGFDPGRLSETLRIGADLRANFNRHDEDEAETTQGFETQSAQMYLHFQPKGSRFSLYVDTQVAPGAALNREAFVMAKLSGNHYLKVGKIMLPYGIRLEDDSAFIRQATQITFDNSDNGVELGLEYKKASFNFALSNGTGGATNDDDAFQYLGRGEFIGNNWRIGASALLNDSVAGSRTLTGIFAGLNLSGFTFLAEIDLITDESIENPFGDDTEQVATLLELNKEIVKGLNFKATHETLDPDSNIDENERQRSSVIIEYTPFSNFQLRSGLRLGDDIPQRAAGNFTDFFVQAHLYY